MSIPGYATPEGTTQFAGKFRDQYPARAYTQLGRSKLTVSRLGFGTYRCDGDSEIHHQALEAALHKGCNLIDTSANYTDGNAELLIGDVINRQTVWQHFAARENLVIVSKAGYIQGENMAIAREREAQGDPFPEVVKYQQGMWHCIHPRFIEDQITRTLARMHLDTLDVYLLHNPEYFLSDAARRSGFDRAETEKAFYDRIRRAFIQMEKLVREGLIRYYGISSNSLPLPADAPDFVSLPRVWKAYEDACLQSGITPEQGHFAVIQLPFNWLEHGAATRRNQEFRGKVYSTLELAGELGLGVLVNRPLNAISGNHLLRLARYGSDDAVDYQAQFTATLQQLQQTEQELADWVRTRDLDIPVQNTRLSELFRAGDSLQRLSAQGGDVSHFREVAAAYLAPVIEYSSSILLRQLNEAGREEIAPLLEAYRSQYRLASEVWLHHLDRENYHQTGYLETHFGDVHPELGRRLSFAQKSLLFATEPPDVSSVLNGMRTPDYVEDSMKILEVAAELDWEKLLVQE